MCFAKSCRFVIHSRSNQSYINYGSWIYAHGITLTRKIKKINDWHDTLNVVNQESKLHFIYLKNIMSMYPRKNILFSNFILLKDRMYQITFCAFVSFAHNFPMI